MTTHPVLIHSQWRAPDLLDKFRATNPATGEVIPEDYPVSNWGDCDAALEAATAAAAELRQTPSAKLAEFLETYAARIENRKGDLVDMAHQETGLPKSPRLADGELPRTTNQLRQAAAAARDGSWKRATIDTQFNIRSIYAPLGPVITFGPNNFPFAYNGIAGGDFASAIAAGNPVIAKAHPLHPGCTRIFAEEAQLAEQETHMPKGTVQLIYDIPREMGLKFVSDPRVGAIGFTGSRAGGLKLKEAADGAGKPIYLEMSSINPVVILPGALQKRREEIVKDYVASALMAAGQFCTNPGFVVLVDGEDSETFCAEVADAFGKQEGGVLFSAGSVENLSSAVKTLTGAGAKIVTQGAAGSGCSYGNTLLRTSGHDFLQSAHALQTEAFGNATMFVFCKNVEEVKDVLCQLEGNLTGSLYTDRDGSDDDAYQALVKILRPRVGRLLNDKMPTGVAVCSAMVHGGPYPSTGHAGFTAVGFPASITRFAQLECYDGVRHGRLPVELQSPNPNGKMWRLVDGHWSQGDAPEHG